MTKYHREWEAQKRVTSPEKAKEAQKRAYERKKTKLQSNPEYRARYLTKSRAWQKAHAAELKEARKNIPDDDPETDLVPMTEGGFVRWAVLTNERRSALGEIAPHWIAGPVFDAKE